MCIYTVMPGVSNLVDAFITSPTTDNEHFAVSEDRRSLRIEQIPTETNKPWSVNLTIEVIPRQGVSKVEFMPYTSFLWNCGLVEEYNEPGGMGTTTGSSVSCAAGSVGTWKWKAKGNYIWEWQSGLCACLVNFGHLQERVEKRN